MSHTLWNSERLFFRGVHPTKDDDFLASLSADPVAFLNAAPLIPTPRNQATTDNFRQYLLSDHFLMHAVICLSDPKQPDQEKLTPIGVITLGREDIRFHHHRHCEIGINILQAYQGQGYGSESIKWALRWGFKRANLHRMAIGAFSWNEGALRLYDRLGFKRESLRREYYFHDGEWQDAVGMAMLDREWRELYDGK